MRGVSTLGLALVTALSLPLRCEASDSVPLAALQGTYFSSLAGGCYLNIHSDRSFSLTCGQNAPLSGRALVVGSEFKLFVGAPAGSVELGQPVPPTDAPSWLVLNDPTLPLINSSPEDRWTGWFKAIRWGDRMYLIRRDELLSFCQAVKDGAEPRSVQEGASFLRLGDHDKNVAKVRPVECLKTKEVP